MVIVFFIKVFLSFYEFFITFCLLVVKIVLRKCFEHSNEVIVSVTVNLATFPELTFLAELFHLLDKALFALLLERSRVRAPVTPFGTNHCKGQLKLKVKVKTILSLLRFYFQHVFVIVLHWKESEYATS